MGANTTVLLNPSQNPLPIPPATATKDGAMSAADKQKLDSLSGGSGSAIAWTATKTWAQVYAEAQAHSGDPLHPAGVVLLDDGIDGATFTIPAGSYNINQMQFLSPLNFGLVTLDAGVTFVADGGAISLSLDGVEFDCNGSICASGLAVRLGFSNGGIIGLLSGTSPVFPGVTGGSCVTGNGFGAPFYGDGVTPALQIAGGSTYTISLFDGGSLNARTIGGAGTLILQGTPMSLAATDLSTVFLNTASFAVGSPFVLPGAYSSVSAVQTGAYTARYSETVRCNPTGGAFPVNLPTAVGKQGVQIAFKNVTTSTNAITITASGGETIDGAATLVINSSRGKALIESDGANWMVM